MSRDRSRIQFIRESYRSPLKGCRGVATDSPEISDRGIRGDREFVLIEEGQLIDPKHTPRIASITADLRREAGLHHGWERRRDGLGLTSAQP